MYSSWPATRPSSEPIVSSIRLLVGSIRSTSPTTGGGLSSPLIWLMSSDSPF